MLKVNQKLQVFDHKRESIHIQQRSGKNYLEDVR